MNGAGRHRMRRGLKNVSLSTRAALLVCTCVAMFFAGLLYLTVRYIERQFMDMLGQHQFTMVGIQAEDLDIKLRTMHETLTAIAKRVTTRTLRRADAAQIFLDDRVFLHRSFDNGIFLVGMDGVIVADSPYKPGRRGFNSAFREFTQVTIQTKKPYISKPYVSMNSPGEPVIMMTAPTFDASGRMNGMLMGSFALLGKNFLSDLSKRRIGRGGYFFLTDRERTMLMFPDRERVMKVAAKPGQNRVYDMAIGGFEGTGETVTSVGLPVLMSVKRLQTVDWLLGASFPLTEVKEPLVQMLRYVLAGTAVALLALMLAVIWLMRRLLRPVSLLTERVRSVAQNERQPITMHAPGELGVLIDSFNEMLLALTRSEAAQRRIEEDIRTLNASLENRVSDRTAKLAAANAELAGALQRLERAQDGLIRSEKLAALGSLVAGVAHELNTPLGNALMVASTLQEKNSAFVREVESGMLRRSILDEYTRANAEASTLIMRSVWQAAELISNFKQVAVDQTSAKRRAFDLKEVIEEVLSTLQHLVKHKPIEVRAQLAEGIRMDSYPGPLGQVLTNFYTNALAHAFEGRAAGVIEIRTRAEGADEVVLEFRDDGNGIPEEHLKKIFDPFFTTKLGQGGSGLGLSIAHNIVTGMLGGRIEMESRPGAGTRFTVVLPVAAPGFDRSNLMSIGVERPAQSGRSAVG